jgi:hypothetical protein
MPVIDPAWWTSGMFERTPVPEIIILSDFGAVFSSTFGERDAEAIHERPAGDSTPQTMPVPGAGSYVGPVIALSVCSGRRTR